VTPKGAGLSPNVRNEFAVGHADKLQFTVLRHIEKTKNSEGFPSENIKNPIDKKKSMVYNGSPYVKVCPRRISPFSEAILPHNMAAVKWQNY
jgi:hypothetical protein